MEEVANTNYFSLFCTTIIIDRPTDAPCRASVAFFVREVDRSSGRLSFRLSRDKIFSNWLACTRWINDIHNARRAVFFGEIPTSSELTYDSNLRTVI